MEAQPYREAEARKPRMGKIVQLVVSERGLAALDDNGLVWFARSADEWSGWTERPK